MSRQWEDAPEETGAPASLHEAVRQTESGGRMGAVSPKGAASDMQVMPATARQPGFGVLPAQDESLEEKSRVGHDTLDAMYRRYDNPEHALVAYNWGPGNADRWIKAGADPKKLPAETRQYIERVKEEEGKSKAPRKWEDAPSVEEKKPEEGAVAKAAKATGQNLLSVADMLLSVPGMAAGVFAGDVPGRIAALVSGGSHRQQSEFAQEQYHKIADPSAHLATDIASKLGYNPTSPSDVESMMGKLTALLDKGGEYIDKATGGAVNIDDVRSLTNEVMALGGVKGAAAMAKGAGAKAAASGAEKPKLPIAEELPRPEDAPPPETPRKLTAKEEAAAAAEHKKAIGELTDVPYKKYKETVKDIKAAKGTVTANEVDEIFNRAKRGERISEPKELPAEPKTDEFPKVIRDRKAQQIEAAWQQRERETGAEGFRTPQHRSVEQAIREATDDIEAPLAPPLGPMQQAFKEYIVKQKGGVDPEYLKFLGATSAGAIAGAYLSEDPKEGAALGAALVAGGLGAARAAGRLSSKFSEAVRKVAPSLKDERYRIDGMRQDWQGTYNSLKLGIFRTTNGLKKLVPDSARRSELTHYIEGSNPEFRPRNPSEQAYVKTITEAYSDLGKAGQEHGVLGKLLPEGSYITHLYGVTGEGLRRAKQMFSSMSPNSRFAHAREFPTLKVAMANGMKPLTTDSADIFAIYGNSMAKTLSNAKFLTQLKSGVHPDGRPLIVPAKGAPTDYVGIPHPQLQGKVIHPDLEPTVKLLFDMDNPGAISTGLQAVAAAAKRSLFSFSMFHAMALTEAAIAKNPNLVNPLKAVGEWKRVWNSIDKFKNGKIGDEVDRAVSAGLVLEPKTGIDTASDVLQTALQKVVDKSAGWVSPGRLGLTAAGAGMGYLMSDNDEGLGAAAGAALAYGGGRAGLRAAKMVDQAMNKFLWEKVHPAYKIATFMSEKEKFIAENAKRIQRGEPPLPEKMIDREVANHVNDIFGGLDWVDIAEGVQNRYGRDVMGSLASRQGRRYMQIGLQAPDWLFSTVRSVSKAFPGVSTPMAARMARQYVASSAIMYLTVGDALNYHFSGHHLWENKDPTSIDLGDGRKMQLNKHFMELAHIAQHPYQSIANKVGYVPRTIFRPAFNPKMSSKQIAQEAIMGLLPIPAQGIIKGETGGSPLAGFFGLPIYGKTEEQKQRDKEEKEFERLMSGSKE